MIRSPIIIIDAFEHFTRKAKMTQSHYFSSTLKNRTVMEYGGLDVGYIHTTESSEVSNIYRIKAGILQESVLRPLLYLIFTVDVPVEKQFLNFNFY